MYPYIFAVPVSNMVIIIVTVINIYPLLHKPTYIPVIIPLIFNFDKGTFIKYMIS